MGVTLRGGRVIAEGHWDARGTLGVDRAVPIGLTDIALTFELDADADAATLQRLVEISERFCVIYQTLRTHPDLMLLGQRRRRLVCQAYPATPQTRRLYLDHRAGPLSARQNSLDPERAPEHAER
jgi:hypothetical protein